MISKIFLLILLFTTHVLAYSLGVSSGEGQGISDDAQLELEKYKVDKQYEYMRWTEERKAVHDDGRDDEA